MKTHLLPRLAAFVVASTLAISCSETTAPTPGAAPAAPIAPPAVVSPDVVGTGGPLVASSTGSTTISKGGLADYQITITGSTTPRPLDVIAVIDESGSIAASDFNLLKNALASMVQQVSWSPTGNHLSFIEFSGDARLVSPLGAGTTPTALLNTISGIYQRGGSTNMTAAIDLALQEWNAQGRGSNAGRVMVFITDGVPNVGGDPCTRDAALASAQVKTVIFGVGSGFTPGPVQCLVDNPAVDIKPISSFAALSAALNAAIVNVAAPRNVVFRATVPSGFSIEGTPTTAAGTITVSGDQLTWSLGDLGNVSRTASLTLRETSNACGTRTALAAPNVTYALAGVPSTTLALDPLTIDVTDCDATPPVITPTVTGTPGLDGWYTGDVSVAWNVADPESGIAPGSATGCEAVTVNTNTTGTTYTCSATNGAGLSSTASTTVKLDKTIPTVSGAVTSGTLGANGWYTSDVGVTWTTSTAGPSGQELASSCASATLASDASSHTFTCTVTTGAGIPSAPATVTVKRDASVPTITYALIGTLGDNGWYTSDVGVVWTTAAGPSGVNGCTSAPVATDGTGITFHCTATAGNGLSASRTTLPTRRDATRPVVAWTGNAGSYTVDQTVNITCSATDATSGIASSTCANVSGAGYTFAPGTNDFTAQARDNAGNTGSATTSFTMTVTDAALCALATRWTDGAGRANSLCAKLTKGNYEPFLNELAAQTGKSISVANAAILRRLVKGMM